MKSPSPDTVVPQALEAEQATLGAMLMEREAIVRVVDILEPADFYSSQHQILYEAMADLFRERVPVDLVTVISRLQDSGRLEMVGGRDYLLALQDPAPTAAAVEHYAALVRTKAVLRRQLEEAARFQEVPTAENATALLEALQLDSGGSIVGGPLVSVEDMLADPDAAPWLVQGVLPEGGLVILAGEGGVGKGWLTLSLGAAVSSGADWLGHFQTERRGPVIIVDFERGRRYQAPRIKDIVRAAGQAPEILFSFRPPKFDPGWLSALADKYRPALLVVDSLTHLLPEGVKDVDNAAMAEVLGKLRAIAERFGCCVCLIHHLRKRGDFADNRPLARVRGATAIVDTADLVLAASRTKEGTLRVEAVKSYWGDAAGPFLCDWVEGKMGGTMLVWAGEVEPEKVAKVRLAQDIILTMVECEPQTREQLDAACGREGISKRTVSDALKALQKDDKIRRATEGKQAVFGLPA